MRAPPLARMAAVAAPRPDADPVTIAHKPSFDIRISPYGFRDRYGGYHIVQANACKSAMFRCAELILPAALLHVALAGCPAETGACHGHGFSPSSGARKGHI